MGLFSWLTGSRSAEPVRASKRELANARVGVEPLSSQFSRIGGNLTPEAVSSILLEADGGNIQRLTDLSNESRQKDCTLHSVLQTRELSLGGLEWQVNPADESRRRSKKVAEFCDAALRQCDTFGRALQDLQGAPYYGHSTDELIWARDVRYVVPSMFSHIQQRRFEFRESDGRLCLSGQNGLGPIAVDLTSQTPGKFITHQPRINGDVPAREGLSRVLMWAALFRNWDIRSWMELGEMGWKPTRIGVYKKGADDADIDALYEVLARLTSSWWAGLPDTTDVRIEWPKGNPVGSTHSELAAFLGAEMAKAVLGQTLTTEAGKNGARSLGDVHDRVRRDILEADARSIEQTITGQLIAPMVAMNFGRNEPVPEFRFVTAETANLESFSKAMSDLGPVLRLPARWAREQIGAPEPIEGEELIGTWSNIPIDPKTGMPEDPDTGDASGQDDATEGNNESASE